MASADQNTFLDLSVPADVTTAKNVIAAVYGNTGGGTNWDAGLDLASGAGVDSAIAITDGNPTVRDSNDSDAASSSDVDLYDLTFGIASANKIKTIGKNGTTRAPRSSASASAAASPPRTSRRSRLRATPTPAR